MLSQRGMPMSDIKVPDEVAAWAKSVVEEDWPQLPPGTMPRGAAEFIVSLLPPPPPPSLRDKIHALLDGYTTSDATNYLTGEVIEIVRADIKENFGWETRITSYLKGQ
jgi:hypothetical protein